ncbi:MAG: hypothetical protein WKI04_09865 [Ferruginibacter sp.]
MIKKIFLCIVFIQLVLSSKSQLAKVDIADPQKSTFKTLGNGLNLAASEENDFYFIPFHQTVQSKDNYFKVGITANYGYFKKPNVSIHVIQLSKALQIEKEFEVKLKPESGEGKLRPVKLYVVENKIELITIQVDKDGGRFTIYNWEFNLSDFSVMARNKNLGSFPYSKNSKYQYLVDVNKFNQSFGICIAERKEKKGQACAVHVLSCDNTMKTLVKQSADFSFKYSKEILSKMRLSDKGEMWALLTETDKKEEISNQVIYGNKEKINFFSLKQNANNIVHSCFSLNKSNNGIYVAGLIYPSGSEFSDGISYAEMSNTGQMSAVNTVDIKKELTNMNADVSVNGFNKNTRIQEVIVRDNDLVDIIVNEYTFKEVTSGNTAFPYDTKMKFGDIYLFSLLKNKLANSKVIRRNITEKQTSSFYINDIRDYSLPNAFSQKNNVYFLYLANTSNPDGRDKDSKLKKETTSQCLFMVAKMDENFNLKSQPLFDYTEKNNFESYAYLTLCPISDTKYMGYHETEFGMTTKAKLTFAVMEIK